MFDILKIKIFGHQPVAKISDKLLDRIIYREFKYNSDFVRAKIKKVNSDSHKGESRISVAILKLADQDLIALDGLIEKANYDFRDVITLAEYPRCAKIGFGDFDKNAMKQIYIDDFIDYSNWLNK
jgi:hypothetical protein